MKNEFQVKLQIKLASDWIIGGYDNEAMNDEDFEMPTRKEIFDEIYDSIMNHTYFVGGGVQYGRPIKEIRFTGKEFIEKEINCMLDKEGL